MPKHKFAERTHTFTLRVPQTMYSQIEFAAEEDRISQNHFIRRAVVYYLDTGREP